MRSPARSVPAVLLTAAVLLLAGCVGTASIPDDLAVEATNAFAVPSDWAYDGRAVRSVDGSISIDVVDSANTGEVVAEIRDGNTTYEVTFTGFRQAPGSDFQDGGIVHGIFEHGDSGHGDTYLPRSYALSAAWGVGAVTKDGEPLLDPLTGDGNLSLHYMVFQGGVRDDGDHAIYSADRSGFYTPSEPGDADVDFDDREVHLLVKSAVARPSPFEETFEATVDETGYMAEHPIPVANGQGAIDVRIQLEGPEQSLYPGQLTFQLRGPDGQELATRTLGGPDQAGTATMHVSDLPGAGNHTLVVTGDAVRTSYTAETRVIYPSPLFLHWFFEDVTLVNVEGEIPVPTVG